MDMIEEPYRACKTCGTVSAPLVLVCPKCNALLSDRAPILKSTDTTATAPVDEIDSDLLDEDQSDGSGLAVFLCKLFLAVAAVIIFLANIPKQ
jgi:hypothetical protein